jgi:molybdopterin/thiamine biosynthesis adenylyltransferase
VLGPVVGTVGSLQALAAIKLLLGQGNDANRLQIWNAAAMRWRTVDVARDPHCKVCGARS